MKNKISLYPFIFCCFITIAVLCALTPLFNLSIPDKQSQTFTAHRVAEDIKVISKAPHSIQHTKERKVVRDYLYYRLEQMGGETQRFEYDSIACKFGGVFDIENIYSVFNPKVVTDSTKYVLLVAHYDSRFFQIVKKDTVYSYGAADDGYGLGVILEAVNVALNYKNDWNQGIKVLFTDSEEHELDGMVNMYQNDSQLLSNVNFVINVEARGVKGPCLLFETSAPNSKIVELYELAKRPHSFSLTTEVYKFLPNDTDFSVVKNSLPGMNFSVIDNLKYYHTNLDNFSNISLHSIQHYGMAISPILEEYLVDSKYADSNALVGDSDNVYFTLPHLGLFAFSKGEYMVLNVVVLLLAIIILLLFLKYTKVTFGMIAKTVKYIVLFAIGAFIIGVAVSYICALTNDLKFSFTDLRYVSYDGYIAVGVIIALIAIIRYFFKYKNSADQYFPLSFMMASILVNCLISLVLYFVFGENFFILIPLLGVVASVFIGIIKYLKWVYWISAAFTVFIGVYFLKILYVAITIGALGAILFISVLYISLFVSQYYCLRRNLI